MNKILLAQKRCFGNNFKRNEFVRLKEAIDEAQGVEKLKTLCIALDNNEGYVASLKVDGEDYLCMKKNELLSLGNPNCLIFINVKHGIENVDVSDKIDKIEFLTFATYNSQYIKDVNKYIYLTDSFGHGYRMLKTVLAADFKFLGEGDFDHLTDEEFTKEPFFKSYLADNFEHLVSELSYNLEMLCPFDQSGDFMLASIQQGFSDSGISLDFKREY